MVPDSPDRSEVRCPARRIRTNLAGSFVAARPDLATRTTGADNGVMVAKLTDSEIQLALVRLPGWAGQGGEIVKWYELPSFPAAIDFVRQIADLAEAADHHPDLDIRYRRLRVALSTHDAGGLTQKDIDLAGQIEAAAESFR